MSKESYGTPTQKGTNKSRQEPWLAARLLLERLPVISSVRVVIKDSSMPVSGMAGTAGLTKGCRWNNAAVGYAGHPDGPGRSHICRPGALVRTGHLRLPAACRSEACTCMTANTRSPWSTRARTGHIGHSAGPQCGHDGQRDFLHTDWREGTDRALAAGYDCQADLN